MDKKEFNVFRCIFFSSFFAFGLFYELIACIFCGLYGGFWAYMSIERKRMAFYCNAESLIISILVVMYAITSFYGVDGGMGMIGFFKTANVFFFLCCAMQLSENQRQQLLSQVPKIGCIMVAMGGLAYIIRPLYGFFYTAGRLGGCFQYANVFALFCLMGLLLAASHEAGTRREQWGCILQVLFLVVGILLSGSRTVALFMILFSLLFAMKQKNFRRVFLPLIAVALAGAGIYAAMTGNMQNVGRFLTASLQSSTFLGRLLYAKDGLRLVWQHPFGLGYLGYRYMEPSVQTGVYSVRFVHNGFLQVALDIGIFPCILLVFIFCRNIVTKRNHFTERMLLLLLALHSMVDFCFEFTGMWLLLVLLLPQQYGKQINMAVGGKLAFYKVGALLLSVASCFIGAAMIPRYFGDAALSVSLIPFYTEAATERLVLETDTGKAVKLAQEILGRNAYIPEAYDVLAVASYQQEEYQEMSKWKKESIRLRRYDTDSYERYIILLSQAIEAAGKEGNQEMQRGLLEDVVAVARRIEKVKEETDPLAYRIRDLPDFALEVETEAYIKQAKQLLAVD